MKEALSKHFRFYQEIIQIFCFLFLIVLQFQMKHKLLYDNKNVTYFVQLCFFHMYELKLLIGNVHRRACKYWRSANNCSIRHLNHCRRNEPVQLGFC